MSTTPTRGVYHVPGGLRDPPAVSSAHAVMPACTRHRNAPSVSDAQPQALCARMACCCCALDSGFRPSTQRRPPLLLPLRQTLCSTGVRPMRASCRATVPSCALPGGIQRHRSVRCASPVSTNKAPSAPCARPPPSTGSSLWQPCACCCACSRSRPIERPSCGSCATHSATGLCSACPRVEHRHSAALTARVAHLACGVVAPAPRCPRCPRPCHWAAVHDHIAASCGNLWRQARLRELAP